jgi:hypothetical protein
MTGFGVDIGHLNSMNDKVLGLRDALANAAGAVRGTGQGEFGHQDLNQVVSQVSGLVHQYLSGLGESVNGMADTLTATAQSYATTDSANAEILTGASEAGGPFMLHDNPLAE